MKKKRFLDGKETEIGYYGVQIDQWGQKSIRG